MDSDRELLAEILQQTRESSRPTLSPDTYFEIFCAEQILKERGFNVDATQIDSGHYGGGKKGADGGIDSLYVFVNGRLLRDDTNLEIFNEGQVDIELIAVQAKKKEKHEEIVLDKFDDFIESCLQLSPPKLAHAEQLYGESLRDAVARFHKVYKNAIVRGPTLKITFYYANIGDQQEEGKFAGGISTKRAKVEARLKTAFSQSVSELRFLGAKELFGLSQKKQQKKFPLEVLELCSQAENYVCLVSMAEFYKLLDDKGVIREHLFEANVRDYNGDVTVNKQIGETILLNDGSVNFWWLNNGITIIVADAFATGKLLTLTDPLIVNGLQTSYEIYKHFKPNSMSGDRAILLRAVKTSDPTTIDRIIKATNSQTKIPLASLHATEEIHRKIEISFKGAGLFYDRRRNYYRNQNQPPKKIVSIAYLAQAMVAIVGHRPDDARARPTTAAEKNYRSLYPENGTTDIYISVAKILKRVDQYLDGLDMDKGDKSNLSFYLAMYAVCEKLKSPKPRKKRIASFDVSSLDDSFLKLALAEIVSIYNSLGRDDRVAKGTEFLTRIDKLLRSKFSKPTKKVSA